MAKKTKKAKKATKAPSNGTSTASNATIHRRYRDALTGRFVTKRHAKKHRKTTTKELLTP